MIRVVLAEDQRMLRGALAALLNMEDDLSIVGEGEDGKKALSLVRELRPDVCVLDVEMPLLSGLEVAEAIRDEGLPSRVLMLTTFARPGYLQRALAAGVAGYVLKDGSSEELADAIRKVHGGGRALSPELTFAAWEAPNPLTPRERDILLLAEQGLSSSAIAKRLFLSHGTVRNYMSELIGKLGVDNRVEAAAKARKQGWI
ncbi:response regulator transcription factor [Paenibacillus sp.]|uniref:response regulator transcription factor n=1 Tax=Paenibacillus sp. TaxID=58172 RepID=UPI00281145BD|nr:response regulator transcription factor [Paenibacillus sp.]